jgi:hypothetical protein
MPPVRPASPPPVLRSSLRQAIDILLGDPARLDQVVAELRAQGLGWRRVAFEVRDLTHVDVTHETLRNWYSETGEPAA